MGIIKFFRLTLENRRRFAIRCPHDASDIEGGKGYKFCSQATLTQLKTLKQLFEMEFIKIIGASRNDYKFSCFKG